MTCQACRLRSAVEWRSGLCSECLRAAFKSRRCESRRLDCPCSIHAEWRRAAEEIETR